MTVSTYFHNNKVQEIGPANEVTLLIKSLSPIPRGDLELIPRCYITYRDNCSHIYATLTLFPSIYYRKDVV